MNEETQKTLISPDKHSLTELVGGPRCGDCVQWPPHTKHLRIAYRSNQYIGNAEYEHEGRNKAIYRKG
jgi:hypothetical protein